MPPLTQLLDLIRSVPPALLATLCIGAALILAGAYFLLSAPGRGTQPQGGAPAAAALAQPQVTAAPPDAQVASPAPAAEPVEVAPEETPAPIQAAPPAEPIVAPPPAAEGARTVLRVVSEPGSDQLAVEVGGRGYASLLDVPEAQRGEIVRAIDALVHFGLARPASAQTAAGPEEYVPFAAEDEDLDWEEEAPPPAAAQAAPPAAPGPDVSARPVTAKPLAPEEVAAPRKRPEAGKGAGGAQAPLRAEDAAAATPAFFAVLNETIERRCEEIPQLQGRHIELRTNADGDLEVVDGNEVFPSIDEVPDELVRNLIRAAIAEWEGL